MKADKRGNGIIRNVLDSEELYCFYNFPVHMGVSEEREEIDLRADLKFKINRQTGMIYIDELIPENILYREAHYNNVGKGWLEHHKAFAKFISKYKYLFTSVFEIGGGTGLLSKICRDIGVDAEWTILDAVPNPIEACPAKYLKGIFNESYQIPEGKDAVVHTHTLEHFYNPQECMDVIGNAMPCESWMFMSVPNMEEMYKRCYTNVLNFEHTYYCAEPYISYMLGNSGYEVVERQLFKTDHSVFYAVKKTGKTVNMCDFSDAYSENRKLFKKWVKFHLSLIDDLNEKMQGLECMQAVYLFGAHVYSQFLIGFGLNVDKIKYVLDNDTSKWNKRLRGTKFKVCSPQILEEELHPVVILHAGTHNKEIKEQLIEINCNTVFI